MSDNCLASEEIENLEIDDMGMMLFNLVHETELGETIIKKFITNDYSFALQQWLMERTAYVEFKRYYGRASEVFSQW